MKKQVSNSWGLSVMPAFVAKCRRKLLTTVGASRCTSLPKGFAIASAAAVLLSACASEVDKGVCGANPTYCSWSYNANKELTVKGTGEMIKNATDLPKGAHYGWDKYRKEMTAVNISGVTVIGEGTFKGCASLTSVSISGVTAIGESAFEGCESLTSVSIGSGVVTIGSKAFNFCNGITKLSLPSSVTTIGLGAFHGCTGLTELSIPKKVTTIGEYAFSGCTGLTELSIPKKVTTIGEGAFAHCTGITKINIPNSVTKIGSGAFYGCTGLTSVTIPDSVTEIGGSTFHGCTGLTSVSIPSSVTKIGDIAFSYCTGLTSMYNYSTTPQNIEGGYDYNNYYYTGFYEVNLTKVTLYVPAGSESKYRAAQGWKKFGQIVAIP